MWNEDFEDYDFPDRDYEPDEADFVPKGRMIDGQWYDVEEIPRGYGQSPDWWDDSCGETYEEYLEHTD